MVVYFNGNYIKKDEVKISPDDRGFLFGDGVYEVIRAYNGKLFRPEDHLERLKKNLIEVRIEKALNINFLEIAAELYSRNKSLPADTKVYIQITRGTAIRKHDFSTEMEPTVYAEISEVVPPYEKWEKGVKIILRIDQRRKRCDIKTISLMTSILDSQLAVDQGAQEVIFYHSGFITEGSHTTFCAIKNGSLYTPPENTHILPGITRKVVKEICAELNIKFIEEPIKTESVKDFDELIILGSTTEIMPVVKVDNWIVGDGKPGTTTKKLQKAYRERILN